MLETDKTGRPVLFPPSGWGRIFLFQLLVSALFLPFAAPRASAQELQSQPVPFTVYLDLKALAASSARNAAFPIWLESVEFDTQKTESGLPEKTVFRLRFRPMAGINDELMLRLFFDDQPLSAPVLTAWSELGERKSIPKIFGSGLGLPTSETVLIPMDSVDYIDISVPGSGANVRGVFLSSARKTEVRRALDFDLPSTVVDPFQGASPAQTGTNDAFLYGRVRATLDDSTIKLSGTGGACSTVEFQLAVQPLVAVVTFEILNASIQSPPHLTVNNRPLGPVALQLPDLADPAFLGSVRALEQGMRFHYAGWLKCQMVLPGPSLQSGSNQMVIQTGDGSEEVAIRAVEVQLKYNWEHLDYQLSP